MAQSSCWLVQKKKLKNPAVQQSQSKKMKHPAVQQSQPKKQPTLGLAALTNADVT
jgi:hypothetical protein